MSTQLTKPNYLAPKELGEGAFLIFNWKLMESEWRVLKQYSEAKGATVFRTSQVLKDVGMLFGGEMFTDASGTQIICHSHP